MNLQQLISTQIKQRRESLEHYGQAGRKDLACSEENEIKEKLQALG